MMFRPRIWTALLSLLTTTTLAQGCNNCTSIPPPWSAKGTIYSILLILPTGTIAGDLPVKAVPPLERQDPLTTTGEYKGILGNLQIIRYTDTPVGPYDELLLVPGFFAYNRTNEEGETEEELRVRVSRMYVNTETAVFNGRKNWNIPKHLAKFDWTDDGNGGVSCKIYPYDTTGDPSESFPASKPWFQFSYNSNLVNNVLNLIDIPFTTDLYKLAGINATLSQPPVPHNPGNPDMLLGTDTWKLTVPGQASGQTSVGTFDLYQGDGDVGENGTNPVGDEYFPNFWPGLGRYQVGLVMENSDISFGDPEIWAV